MINELLQSVLSGPAIIDRRLAKHGNPADPYYRFFAKLVLVLKPKCVVELGTGAGHTAALIMAALPYSSTFTTINWPNPPSGDDVGRELKPWSGDIRLTQLLGDTRDQSIVAKVPNGIDLLYIDSGTVHEYALIAAEWELYRPKLADEAIVVCDDIHFLKSDMERFWEPLPYEKIEINGGQAGMFRYVR